MSTQLPNTSSICVRCSTVVRYSPSSTAVNGRHIGTKSVNTVEWDEGSNLTPDICRHLNGEQLTTLLVACLLDVPSEPGTRRDPTGRRRLCSCRYWDLGIHNALAKFLEDPEIREHIKSRAHRTTDDHCTYFGSPSFATLNSDCAGILTQVDAPANTMLVSLGGDGVQLLNWGARTATVIALKCEDLPPHLIQTGRAVSPLIIIEGPSEPSTLNHVLQNTASFLVDHAPSSAGQGAVHPN